MKDIEILPSEAGVPTVTLHGEAKAAADAKGVVKVHLSLSHSEVRVMLSCSENVRLIAFLQTVAIAFAQASSS